MEIATIKAVLDACYQAQRIRAMLPTLPDGVTPSYIHFFDLKYTPCQGQIKKKGFNFPASRWLYHYISLPSSLSISDKGIFPLIGYIPVVIY